MKLLTVFMSCKSIISKKMQEKPNGGLILNGEKVSYKELVSALERLVSWVHPEIDSKHIRLVTICENCRYYNEIKHICKRTDIRRKPEFFCAEGDSKYE